MIFRLALADTLHERQMAACYAVALAAVLAPLMVLYGLKTGVITALTTNLLQDPRNLEIIVLGNRDYTGAYVQGLADRDDVGFAVPRTRSIAATLYIERSDGQGGPELAELVPTAPGDPLIDPEAPPLEGNGVALSHALATALEVAPGDTVRASAVREVDGQRQRVMLDLDVTQVLPQAAFGRRAAFAPLPLLQAVEDYRDGLAVQNFGWDGRDPGEFERVFASFRIYARDLDSVGSLADFLTREGIEVRSQLAEIETVRDLDTNLTRIFTIIALLGGAGYLLSMGANLWSNVKRKTRELSVMRLLGVPAVGLLRFPIFQANFVAILGMVLAFGIYFLGETVINLLFAAPGLEGQPVVKLLPLHYAFAIVLTLVAAIVAAAVAGWRASRIEPSEGMRDV